MRYLPFVFALFLALGAVPAFAGTSVQKGYAAQKGSECATACRKHCCHGRKAGSRSSRSADTTSRASGPVAEPVSVTGLVAMPMMSFRTMTPTTASRSANTCDRDDDRIEELDARVEALHLRLVTMQRSVELQTTILEELRDSGTIGGQPLKGLQPKLPTPVDASATEAKTDAEISKELLIEQRESAIQGVTAWLDKVKSDPTKETLKEFLEKELEALKKQLEEVKALSVE